MYCSLMCLQNMSKQNRPYLKHIYTKVLWATNKMSNKKTEIVYQVGEIKPLRALRGVK